MSVLPTRRASTLVELLIVIVIVGILAALLFPALGKARAQADLAKCLSNLRTLGVAINQFASDNDNRLPGPIGSGISGKMSTGTGTSLINKLQPYLGLPEPTSTTFYAQIARCPAVRGALMGAATNWYDVTMYAAYSSNDMPADRIYLNDMAVQDSQGTSWPVGPWGRQNSTPSTPGWRSVSVQSQINSLATGPTGQAPNLGTIPAIYETDGMYPPRGKAAWPWLVPTKAAHGKFINILFFDWHVGQMPAGSYSTKTY